jgi:hypothetical protein
MSFMTCGRETGSSKSRWLATLSPGRRPSAALYAAICGSVSSGSSRAAAE